MNTDPTPESGRTSFIGEQRVKPAAPPYSNNGIQHAAAAGLLTASAVGALALFTNTPSAYMWALPLAVSVGMMGIGLAAPRIPKLQIALAIAAILLVNFLIEEVAKLSGVVPIIKLGELVFPILCVAGFGRHWAKHGYIPAQANTW